MTDIARLKSELEGLRIEDNPAIVRQKSRDFFWYSPVLKRQLDHVTADLVVSPRNEADVIRVLAACHRLGVPVTARGAGAGNYGQAMPLAGGVVMSLADMNRVIEIGPGRVRAEPGAILAAIDRETRPSGQELRLHPSTYNTASIGGFIAGGSGGVGSINWGGLRDLGNVLRLRIVTMEAVPRILDLTGWDLHKVMHAYGTNGIITEVDVPLDIAYDWIEVIAGFDDWMDAVRFADVVGNQDGLLLKEIAPVAAPLPHDYFLRHQKFIRRDQSVVLLMVARHAIDPFMALAAREHAAILFRSDSARETEKRGLPPVFELAWNHTTLRGLRVDPSITYLQTLHRFPGHVESVRRITEIFGDEVPGHLEFVRFDGKVTCFGLPIVRYTGEARLDEIVRIYEDNGCPIFNPHRYTLEEGGMKQTDAVQLAFKRQADPDGLLNPGKMIGWENPDFGLDQGKTLSLPRPPGGWLMRILVVYAHPVAESFVGALHRTAVEALRKAGHEVDDCDLYAEGFDPVLSRQERIDYHDLDINRRNVDSYVERLLRAEALVLIHPVWNFGYPAILKGFLDRVFLPGVSFQLHNGQVWPNLQNIRKLAAVVTYGGDRVRAFLVGDPPRRLLKRVVRACIHPLAKTRYLALYDMNRNDEAVRKAFLDRVARTMARF